MKEDCNIDNAIRVLNGLIDYFDDRESHIQGYYSNLFKSNLINTILLWIENIESGLGDVRYLGNITRIEKDPIYLILNQILNYIDMDDYSGLMTLMNQIDVGDSTLFFTPPPEEHSFLINDLIILRIAKLYVTGYIKEYDGCISLAKELCLGLSYGCQNVLLLLKTIKQIGKFYYKTSEFKRSLELLNVGLERYIGISSPQEEEEKEYGYILNLLGLNSLEIDGREEDGLAFFESALQVFKKYDMKEFMVHINNNLGIFYWKKFDLNTSEKYIYEAYCLHRELGNKWGMGSTMSNLGVLNLNRHEYEKAKECYLNAITHYNEIVNPSVESELAMAYDGLATALKSLGEYNEAEEYFRSALKIFQNAQNLHQYNVSAIGYSELKLILQKFEDAIQILESTFQAELSESIHHLVIYLSYIIIAYTEINDRERAEQYLQQLQSLDLTDTIFVDIPVFCNAYYLSTSDDLRDLADSEHVLEELVETERPNAEIMYAYALDKLISLIGYRYNIKKNPVLLEKLQYYLNLLIKIATRESFWSLKIKAAFHLVELHLREKNSSLLSSLADCFDTIMELPSSEYKKYFDRFHTLISENRDVIKEVLLSEKDIALVNRVTTRININESL